MIPHALTLLALYCLFAVELWDFAALADEFGFAFTTAFTLGLALLAVIVTTRGRLWEMEGLWPLD